MKNTLNLIGCLTMSGSNIQSFKAGYDPLNALILSFTNTFVVFHNLIIATSFYSSSINVGAIKRVFHLRISYLFSYPIDFANYLRWTSYVFSSFLYSDTNRLSRSISYHFSHNTSIQYSVSLLYPPILV